MQDMVTKTRIFSYKLYSIEDSACATSNLKYCPKLVDFIQDFRFYHNMVNIHILSSFNIFEDSVLLTICMW